MLEYRHENGRRYHKFRDGCRCWPFPVRLPKGFKLIVAFFPAYLLPNDESENDRLDMTHELCLLMLQRKLYLAPIKNPQRVIDLGTGTGIWAIDFGKHVCWS